MSRAIVALAVSCTLGCGGEILGDDGGSADVHAENPVSYVDASEPVDANAPNCTPFIQQESGTSANCIIGGVWSCDGTNYFVDCSCPPASCTCSSHNDSTDASSGSQPQFGGCPSCASTPQQLAQLCGFPL